MVTKTFPTGGTMKIEYLECGCNSAEHAIRVIMYDDKESVPCIPEFHINVQLTNRAGFFKRLWLALKYVFNPVSDDYHWVETTLEDEDVNRLLELLSEYKELNRESMMGLKRE